MPLFQPSQPNSSSIPALVNDSDFNFGIRRTIFAEPQLADGTDIFSATLVDLPSQRESSTILSILTGEQVGATTQGSIPDTRLNALLAEDPVIPNVITPPASVQIPVEPAPVPAGAPVGSFTQLNNNNGDFVPSAVDRSTQAGPVSQIRSSTSANPVPVTAGTEQVREVLASRAQEVGWTGTELNALNQLIFNESSFNPTAQNPNSSAFGLFQFIASTAADFGLSHPANGGAIPSLSAQITAGFAYIRQRYGTPAGALAHWNARVPIDFGDGRGPVDVGHWY